MNFFEHQEQARRNTAWLVILFLMAVASLIAITYLLLVLFFAYVQGNAGTDVRQLFTSINTAQLISIALCIGSVVLIASLYKFLRLGSDGRAVAESLGGVAINPSSTQFHERRLLNVVEEMAIASGVPVPPVYLLEDNTINAFAAGYSVNTAVIGVTRGCMELLNRDELQGVVAHEFSHIFNGDMKLNMRLIGVLHGVLVIGIAGRLLFRLVARSGYRGRSNKNQSALPFLAVGAGLMVVGYLGTFFGNIIKAAVSRQREFLADASAVQYTRDPTGISLALQKIGGVANGSLIESTEASECSHLFFGQAIQPFFNAIMATHPPLEQRIRRVTPNWDGQYPSVSKPISADPLTSESNAINVGAAADPRTMGFAANPQPVPKERITRLIESEIGDPSAESLDHARQFLTQLPDDIHRQTQDHYGARAVVYCVLLDDDDTVREQQWEVLRASADPGVVALARSLDSATLRHPSHRLQLIDLCMPALRLLSAEQYRVFKSVLVKLIRADQKVALYEWALYRVIVSAIEGGSSRFTAPSNLPSLKYASRPAALLLSALAASAATSEQEKLAAFAAGKRVSGLRRIAYQAPETYQLRDLSLALRQLNRLKPLQKPKLLKSLCATAGYDDVFTPVEVELIRAVADCLDCPMPPIQ